MNSNARSRKKEEKKKRKTKLEATGCENEENKVFLEYSVRRKSSSEVALRRILFEAGGEGVVEDDLVFAKFSRVR